MSSGKLLYFDCSSGAAGDMLLASMLDCGLSHEEFKKKLSSLPLDGYALKIYQKNKGSINSLQVELEVLKKQHLRHFPEIKNLIQSSGLSTKIQEKSIRIFQILATAEAKVHGIPEDKVHFHEIGALDSILDIVGSAIALDMLAVDSVYASPLPLGKGGWVKTEHGPVPLPAPATMEIIKTCRIPCYGIDLQEENVTPTGAAVLGAICTAFSPLPSMLLEKIGYGAGQKEFHHPNIVRAFLGTPYLQGENCYGQPGLQKNSGSCWTEPLHIIEANVDDLNPEIYDYVLECLFACGALDVYFTPIQMKKNRPAIKITVLSKPQEADLIGQTLLRETTTLGYRRYSAEKIMLPRKQISVTTPWGDVKVKIGEASPEYRNIAPEYEDCLQIARSQKIPLKKVYQTVWGILSKG